MSNEIKLAKVYTLAYNQVISFEWHDAKHSNREDRFIRIGYSNESRVLVVVFCERQKGEVIRIISARKALPMEVSEYEERI